ncbi:hypothetical protein BGZ96_003504 [Linnemannia gamsii]|uniref:Extracellular membrane protein CFEM domain-containing protein n=1 Tax=Linnemannia gamsii TaxID=64522 RepID=A0ABQ7K854_9FUNG|nr:hypothetical protein BGZ96_003504 [Linnemannia gamsii]
MTAPGPACMICINTSVLTVSPACDAETMSTFGFIGPGVFEKMAPKQKRCNCMLSIYDSWTKSCTFQDACTNENASYLQKTLINIRGDVRCMPAVGPEDQFTNTTATVSHSATVAAPVTANPTAATPTPTGNGGDQLGASCSKLLAGATLMQFSTIIAFIMALILAISVATVSAQASSDACLSCIFSSVKTASPTCSDALIKAKPPTEGLTLEQKDCYCPLSKSDTWVQRCVQSGECLASDAPIMYARVSNLKHICTAVPQPMNGLGSFIGRTAAETLIGEGVKAIISDAGTLMGSSSKVPAGVSVVVAMAAALLM